MSEAMHCRIIVLDRHPLVSHGIRIALEQDPTIVVIAETRGIDETLLLLAGEGCDVLVTSMDLKGRLGGAGLSLLHALRKKHPEVGVVILSDGCPAAAVRDAFRGGAIGIVCKTQPISRFLHTVVLARKGIRSLAADPNGQFRIDGFERLSPTEQGVLRLLAKGRGVGDVSRILERAPATISTHKSSAMRKLGLGNNLELHDFLRQIEGADSRSDQWREFP